jgi:hypothetical protein
MLEGIDRYILCDKEFPEMAGVANAVGAAAGTGGMHLDMAIIPDAFGKFILYSPEGKHIYRNVGEAKEAALEISRDSAVSYAARMGYERFALDIHLRDRSAPTAFGTDLYIDTSIVSTMRY